jgi:regulator of sirC expression with transglutaminase-like and TPR domain
MSDDPLTYLKAVGESTDAVQDIARAALMLAALDHPGTPLEPLVAHLDEIAAAMTAQRPMIRRVGDGARALSQQLAGQLGYDGDRTRYDDPRNADLISVIGRRRGLPVALGILYIHAARAAGLSASGLNTQGHFLIRVGYRHDDVTLDPFNGGAVIDSEHLPVELRGGDVGLAQPVGDIDVLLRLQNNLKMRALEKGEHERGLELSRRMVLIAPRRPDLWFDLARLNEAVGILGAARQAYEACLQFARRGETLHNEATLSLAHLKRRLN